MIFFLFGNFFGQGLVHKLPSATQFNGTHNPVQENLVPEIKCIKNKSLLTGQKVYENINI